MSDTDADLTALIADVRPKAEAATPGPWTAHEEHGRDYTDEGWSYVAVRSEGADLAVTYPLPSGYEHDQHEADAAHIARMDPDTTLRLVAAVERLREWRRELLDAGFGYDDSEESAKEVLDWQPAWRAAADAAEAEVADLRTRLADAEATIQRVRELPEKMRSVVGSPEPRAWSRWAAERIDAALDGPQDGGEGR